MSKPINTAIILAAGFGERIKPLSLVRPKPLLPVLNKSMLAWWLEALVKAGVKHIIVNAHHLAEEIIGEINRQVLHPRYHDVKFYISCESEIMGTGGALKGAAAHLKDGDFYLVNSDIFTDLDLLELAEAHLRNPRALATMALFNRPDLARVSLGELGQVVGFRASHKLPGEVFRLAYSGMMVLRPRILDEVPDGFSDLIDLLGAELKKGEEISSHIIGDFLWQDIGTLADYLKINRIMSQGQPVVDRGAQVFGQIKGFAVVAHGTVIETGAVVEDSVIWPGSTIEAGAVVRDSVVYGLVPAGSLVESTAWVRK